jgi:hypothetical protein
MTEQEAQTRMVYLPNTLPPQMFDRLCLSLNLEPEQVIALTFVAGGGVEARVDR